jgi:CubicO group peptidase (beta-lactamase class C family)
LAAEKGEIIINQGYDLADKKNKIQNTSNTIFNISSNTKQFLCCT